MNTTRQNKYHLMEYVQVMKEGPVTTGNSHSLSNMVPENISSRGYKTFFMLNSPEHEIYPAHKC